MIARATTKCDSTATPAPACAVCGAGADELAGLTDLPFGFYGHSMGGWVAMDLAKELERRGTAPRFVAVGALPTVETMRTILPPPAQSPEEIAEDFVLEVMKRMQVPAAVLEHPRFRDQAIARTRRDLWLGLQGEFEKSTRAGDRPKSPVWVFGGNDDPVGTVDKQGTALQAQQVVMVPGGHLFVEEPAAGEAIARKLSGALSR